MYFLFNVFYVKRIEPFKKNALYKVIILYILLHSMLIQIPSDCQNSRKLVKLHYVTEYVCMSVW